MTAEITATYRSAIADALAFRDHRLNSTDKTAWWRAVHRLMTRHAPGGGLGRCSGCGGTWACMTVTAAIADPHSGHLGY